MTDADRSWLWFGLIVTAGVGLDQLLKALVRADILSFSTSFVKTTLIYNTGTLFSIVTDANTLFLLLTILIVAVLVTLAYREPRYRVWLALPIAGGIGNGIDRVLFGGVVDFIDFGWWPVFNLADSMVVVGVAVLAILVFNEKR